MKSATTLATTAPPLFGRLETSRLELAHRLAEGALWRRGITPRRYPTSHGLLRIFDIEGTVPDWQERPPLVMIHGLGASGLALLPLALSLDGERRCLLVDLFDFAGDSQRTFSAFGVRPLRVAEHAQTVVAMLDAAGIAEYDLYGVSLGAWTALHIAALTRAPRRLLAVNPLGLRADIQRLQALSQLSDDAGIDVAAELFAGERAPGRWPMAQNVARFMLRAGAAVGRTRDFARAIDDSDALDELLGGIRAEVHLLAGDHDRLVPQGSAQDIFERLPASTSSGVWAVGAAHDVPVRSPGLVTRVLRDFVGCTQTAARAPGFWARARLHVGSQPPLRPMERS